MYVDQLINDAEGDNDQQEQEEEKKAAAENVLHEPQAARDILDAAHDNFSDTNSAASNKTNPGGAGSAKVSGQAVDPSLL